MKLAGLGLFPQKTERMACLTPTRSALGSAGTARGEGECLKTLGKPLLTAVLTSRLSSILRKVLFSSGNGEGPEEREEGTEEGDPGGAEAFSGIGESFFLSLVSSLLTEEVCRFSPISTSVFSPSGSGKDPEGRGRMQCSGLDSVGAVLSKRRTTFRISTLMTEGRAACAGPELAGKASSSVGAALNRGERLATLVVTLRTAVLSSRFH